MGTGEDGVSASAPSLPPTLLAAWHRPCPLPRPCSTSCRPPCRCSSARWLHPLRAFAGAASRLPPCSRPAAGRWAGRCRLFWRRRAPPSCPSWESALAPWQRRGSWGGALASSAPLWWLLREAAHRPRGRLRAGAFASSFWRARTRRCGPRGSAGSSALGSGRSCLPEVGEPPLGALPMRAAVAARMRLRPRRIWCAAFAVDPSGPLRRPARLMWRAAPDHQGQQSVMLAV